MMLLKGDESAFSHREAKRTREIKIIISALEKYLELKGNFKNKPVILEFGCGNGFQLPYLKELGNVVGTDIYTSREIKRLEDPCFCESSIYQLPFLDNRFDLIFSNHVIEHIPNIELAFQELKRVSKPEGLFAFSVPTNWWLLLSLPSKYLGKMTEAGCIIRKKLMKNGDDTSSSDFDMRMEMEKSMDGGGAKKRSVAQLILPKGHGVYEKFGECYRSFRIDSWKRFLVSNGFHLLNTVPLLLYGPSERPIIPTTSRFTNYGLCSSVLFLMTKAA